MKGTKKITVGGIKYKINLLDPVEWMLIKRKIQNTVPIFSGQLDELETCTIILREIVVEPAVKVDDFESYGDLMKLIKLCIEAQN